MSAMSGSLSVAISTLFLITGLPSSFFLSFFLIKAPYIVNTMALNDSCELLLTVAGGFVLPEPADGVMRLMVSAGVGIVAFMSGICSVAALADQGLVKQKIRLALIHCKLHEKLSNFLTPSYFLSSIHFHHS